MARTTLRRAALAVFLLIAMFCQETWALAGTTGGLTGTVLDAQSNAPIAGAKVTVTSPSQTASTTTDAAGHFTILSLAPDTYTVAVEHSGYEPVSVPGQTVFADTTQSVAVRMATQLKTIATVRTQGTGSLVKSGTTADVYAINAAQQQAVSSVGGGGGLRVAPGGPDQADERQLASAAGRPAFVPGARPHSPPAGFPFCIRPGRRVSSAAIAAGVWSSARPWTRRPGRLAEKTLPWRPP